MKAQHTPTSAFVLIPALAAATLLSVTNPDIILSQASPSIQSKPSISEQKKPKPKMADDIELPSSIGGLTINKGSDLEKILKDYFSDDNNTDVTPLGHGR